MNKYAFLALALITVWSCGKNENKSEVQQNQANESVVSTPAGETSQLPAASVSENNDQMVSSSSVAEQPNTDGKSAVLTFEKTSHDFGKIKAGEKVKHVFKFKNTGDAPLMITKVSPACGCTAPEWTKDPVPPGGSGSVTLEFDSQGRSGVQNKTASVESNTKGGQAIILSFKTEVMELSDGPIKK